MRYYKRVEQGLEDPDPHFFREDEIHEAIDNLNDAFFPITVSVISKREYMDGEYEGEWSQEDWDQEE